MVTGRNYVLKTVSEIGFLKNEVGVLEGISILVEKINKHLFHRERIVNFVL